MLKFLGIVFLSLIGLVVAFFIWVFFKTRSSMEQHARVSAIEEGMKTPAIVLEPFEQSSLVQPEAVAELTRQAVALGATTCGNYAAPAAGARLCAYCLETPPVYVVIYDHDQVDPWTDVVLRLDKDRSFMASTLPEIARGAPRHPDDEAMYFAPGTVIDVLVHAATERGNGDSVLPATPEDFKTYFEAAAEKSREYCQTQAVSQEWLSTIAEDTGVDLSGDEAEQINLMREVQQVTQTENDCFKTLAESGDFTAVQWNEFRDNLVAVWNEMPNENVSAVIYDHVDIPEKLESAVLALEEGDGLARERIAKINVTLPEENRLILVGTVSSPVEADIYRDQIPVV